MYSVIKRDGATVEFDLKKIGEAIIKAFESQNKRYHQDTIDFLSVMVTADFEPKIIDDRISVEEIQDSVEEVLIKGGYADVAKSYILNREKHTKMRNMKYTIHDFKETVDR